MIFSAFKLNEDEPIYIQLENHKKESIDNGILQ